MENRSSKTTAAVLKPFRIGNFSETLAAGECDPSTEIFAPCAQDKISRQDIVLHTLKEMLEDPMVRLIMRADGVSEAELRRSYIGLHNTGFEENFSIQAAENEGMSPVAG